MRSQKLALLGVIGIAAVVRHDAVEAAAKFTENKNIIGAYVGAVEEHFAKPNNRLFVGLFSFSMYFNPNGYHEAINRVGVVFQGGRKHSMDLRVANVGSPDPVTGNANPDLEFWAQIPNASSVEETIVSINYYATLQPSPVKGQILPGTMTHVDTDGYVNTRYSTTAGIATYVDTPVRFEVDRVFEKVTTTASATRVRIRR